MWVQHPVKPRVPRPHPLLSPALCVCSVLHEVVGDSQAPVWVLHPRSTPGSWGEWVQAPHPACTQPVVAGHPGSFWICPTAGSWWGPRWGCRGASVPPGAVACPGEHLGGGVSHLLACMWSTPASGSQQEQAPCVPSSPRLSPGSPHLFHHFRGTPQPARACEAVGLHPPVGAGCWVLPAPGCCCRGNGFVGLHHLLVPPGQILPTCPSSPGCMAHGRGLGRVARQPRPSASCRSSIADAKNWLAHMCQVGRLRCGGTQAPWGTAAAGWAAGPAPLTVPCPCCGWARVLLGGHGAGWSPVPESQRVPAGMMPAAERSPLPFGATAATHGSDGCHGGWVGGYPCAGGPRLRQPGWRPSGARWAQQGGRLPHLHRATGKLGAGAWLWRGGGCWGKKGGWGVGRILPCWSCVGAAASPALGLVPAGGWAAELMGMAMVPRGHPPPPPLDCSGVLSGATAPLR